MSYTNHIIIRILSNEFGISKADIEANTNLISEYNLCGWELAWLYTKIEQAFKIEIDLPVPDEELSVKKLVDDVHIIRTGYVRKRQACQPAYH